MSLNNDPLVKAIKKLILEQINQESAHLVTNKCKSLEEYKHVTGVIKGLNLSVDCIDAAIKSYLVDDDE